MGLADTLKAGPPITVKRCGVQKWLDRQGQEDRAEFEALAPIAHEQRDGWNVQKLYDVCADNGLHVNYDALGKHINGRCSCDTR